jgi:hypothetical protein
VKFHIKQLQVVCKLVESYEENGFIYVSCSTWHSSETPENYNAHFPLLLKMFKDGKNRNIIIDLDGSVYLMGEL